MNKVVGLLCFPRHSRCAGNVNYRESSIMLDAIYDLLDTVGFLIHLGTRPPTRVPVMSASSDQIRTLIQVENALLVDLRYGISKALGSPNSLCLPAVELLAGDSPAFTRLKQTLERRPVVFFDLSTALARDAVLQAGLTRGRLFVSSIKEVEGALSTRG